MSEIVAVIVAAGASTRMGSDKVWADLAGRPVLAYSLDAFTRSGVVDRLVVVAPAERHEAITALPCSLPVMTVVGGARRQDSVAAGINAAPDAAFYLVHDGARPLVTPALITRTLEAARGGGAALPGVALVDTIRRVTPDGALGGVIDRETLRAVQTPQAFAGDLLRRAHADVREDVTDDAAMVERLGLHVALVDGDPANIKITTPSDLAVAQALLAERRAGTYRERSR